MTSHTDLIARVRGFAAATIAVRGGQTGLTDALLEVADLVEEMAEHIADVEKGSEGLADELAKAWAEIERLKELATPTP